MQVLLPLVRLPRLNSSQAQLLKHCVANMTPAAVLSLLDTCCQVRCVCGA